LNSNENVSHLPFFFGRSVQRRGPARAHLRPVSRRTRRAAALSVEQDRGGKCGGSGVAGQEAGGRTVELGREATEPPTGNVKMSQGIGDKGQNDTGAGRDAHTIPWLSQVDHSRRRRSGRGRKSVGETRLDSTAVHAEPFASHVPLSAATGSVLESNQDHRWSPVAGPCWHTSSNIRSHSDPTDQLVIISSPLLAERPKVAAASITQYWKNRVIPGTKLNGTLKGTVRLP